jgi:hypothetical protein
VQQSDQCARDTGTQVARLPAAKSATPAKPIESDIGSEHAIEEINAYMVIRDSLLAEAEQVPTRKTLKRANLVNDFVETCLRPARSPYEAQYLPEAEAVRERKRCQAVKLRIAELGARISQNP